ncbi:CBS domain-containing protein [Marinobacter orientalis]|uniref:CBS domain-containing protein n=1 Tax=Marinobacter orientalis TaxID=1928859 RepID=A0A7Y0WS77_9GAMM|nr:CBS domain-containing protein [Marinobacter orientalis]NMT63536.1 CBS domain-containing protein [Marinobacter orientalis]TGX48592.1 CBS domain-containing protein [Marinobacter orientalis]
MQVKEVMTKQPEYLNDDVTIREVANAMRDNGTGFEPLTDGTKVTGVITDRDIAVRAVAEGKSPDDKASSVATGKVLYTFEDESIDDVIQNMANEQVQRLLVLNNAEDKDLVGIVTLGDIADHCKDDELAKKVVSAARHYH